MTPFDITTAPLDGGVTLIEASAGTGKTYSITGLILRLILEKHLPIRDILAVTFTEAATQELRDRIRRRLQSALEDLHQRRLEGRHRACVPQEGRQGRWHSRAGYGHPKLR